MVIFMQSTQTPFALDITTQATIQNSSFLQLLNSTEAYPKSKGTGVPIVRVTTPLCSADIALQGAHLLHFCATNGSPLLWVSPNCDFTPGVALRGGIPVCLPWFGPHPTDSTKPKHGFARNRRWQLSNATLLDDGSAELIFYFASEANELFNYSFAAQLTIILGKTIRLSLDIYNQDQQAFDCSWVLHSYYPVHSLADVRVKGLAARSYLDNLENHARKNQSDDVSFIGEVDRVFPEIENNVEIVGTPHIIIEHHNCPSVVVWNPGPANAAKIADIGTGNDQTYICVERGAVLNEKWHLAAGEKKSAQVEIKEVI